MFKIDFKPKAWQNWGDGIWVLYPTKAELK